MFTIERYHLQNSANSAKKAIPPRGTRLATDEFVKGRHTYRNLVLAVGICVALIVAFTLWAQRNRSTLADATDLTTILSHVDHTPSFLGFIWKTTKVDFD